MRTVPTRAPKKETSGCKPLSPSKTCTNSSNCSCAELISATPSVVGPWSNSWHLQSAPSAFRISRPGSPRFRGVRPIAISRTSRGRASCDESPRATSSLDSRWPRISSTTTIIFFVLHVVESSTSRRLSHLSARWLAWSMNSPPSKDSWRLHTPWTSSDIARTVSAEREALERGRAYVDFPNGHSKP